MQLSEKGRSESGEACYPIMPGCKPQCQRHLRACMVCRCRMTRPHASEVYSHALQQRQYKPKKCLDAPEIVEHVVGLKPQEKLKKQEMWKQTISYFFHPRHPGQGCGDPKTENRHGKMFEESQNRKGGKAPAHPQLWLLDAMIFATFLPKRKQMETTPCLHVFVEFC